MDGGFGKDCGGDFDFLGCAADVDFVSSRNNNRCIILEGWFKERSVVDFGSVHGSSVASSQVRQVTPSSEEEASHIASSNLSLSKSPVPSALTLATNKRAPQNIVSPHAA